MARQSPPSVVTTLRHTVRAGLVPLAVVLVFWIFGAVAIYFLLFEGRPDGEVDAIYWAAMMITGMGPPVLPDDGAVAAKLFLSCYSVAAAFLLLTAAGFALQPVFARVLHIFHLDDA